MLCVLQDGAELIGLLLCQCTANVRLGDCDVLRIVPAASG